MISGVRGSGKTVFMTQVSRKFEEMGWIVIPINPERNLLNGFAAKLYDEKYFRKEFLKAKLDLSILGIGVSIEGATPVSDVEVAIERMLEVVKKRGKRLLITIDEVTSNKYIRESASSFQILTRKDLPVFLLMTGLSNNIDKLRNEDTLTFLYRAFRIKMDPLNIALISERYSKIFNISKNESDELALLTKGYPYAFQVLGYIMTEEHTTEINSIIGKYDAYLSEYSYDKIWIDISPACKKVAIAMAEIGTDEVKNKDIRDHLQVNSSKFAGYRDSLLKSGIVKSDNYGYLSFILPRFKEFVLRKKKGM